MPDSGERSRPRRRQFTSAVQWRAVLWGRSHHGDSVDLATLGHPWPTPLIWNDPVKSTRSSPQRIVHQRVLPRPCLRRSRTQHRWWPSRLLRRQWAIGPGAAGICGSWTRAAACCVHPVLSYSETKSSTDRTCGASSGCSASFRANLSSPVMTCVSRRTARVRYVASYTVIPVLTASA